MRKAHIAAVVIAFGGLVVSLWALPVEPFASPTMNALEQTGATIEDWPVRDFTVFTPEGQAVPLSSLRGRPVYLTYWAEWCDVCKSELPALDRLARAQSGRIDVLTVTIDNDPSASYRYLQSQFPEGPAFRVLTDPGGQTTTQFGTTGVPETFVIDSEGTVLARYVGAHDFTSAAHQRLANQLVSR